MREAGDARPVEGGLTSPDGKTTVLLDLASFERPKNIASKGLGCCGFRVLDYAARLQAVPKLIELPEQMRTKGIAGGAYPQKVAKILAEFDGSATYYQDTTKDMDMLNQLLKSKRMPCIDYNGHDPHYSGAIAHCVNLVALDRENDWAAILDNNYPELTQLVWMNLAALRERWSGWQYGLLAVTPGLADNREKKGAQQAPAEEATGLRYERTEQKPEQYGLMRGDRQLGIWDAKKQQYWRLLPGGGWSKPEAPPLRPPGAKQWPVVTEDDGVLNFGVLREEMGGESMTTLNGQSASKAKVLEAIGGEMVPASKPGGPAGGGGVSLSSPILGVPFWILLVFAAAVLWALLTRREQ